MRRLCLIAALAALLLALAAAGCRLPEPTNWHGRSYYRSPADRCCCDDPRR